MIEVEVTEDDINNGERGRPSSCPIALACRRLFPLDLVSVGSNFVTISNRETFTQYKLSIDGKIFVEDFDHRKPVAPATISLYESPLNSYDA